MRKRLHDRLGFTIMIILVLLAGATIRSSRNDDFACAAAIHGFLERELAPEKGQTTTTQEAP